MKWNKILTPFHSSWHRMYWLRHKQWYLRTSFLKLVNYEQYQVSNKISVSGIKGVVWQYKPHTCAQIIIHTLYFLVHLSTPSQCMKNSFVHCRLLGRSMNHITMSLANTAKEYWNYIGNKTKVVVNSHIFLYV